MDGQAIIPTADPGLDNIRPDDAWRLINRRTFEKHGFWPLLIALFLHAALFFPWHFPTAAERAVDPPAQSLDVDVVEEKPPQGGEKPPVPPVGQKQPQKEVKAELVPKVEPKPSQEQFPAAVDKPSPKDVAPVDKAEPDEAEKKPAEAEQAKPPPPEPTPPKSAPEPPLSAPEPVPEPTPAPPQLLQSGAGAPEAAPKPKPPPVLKQKPVEAPKPAPRHPTPRAQAEKPKPVEHKEAPRPAPPAETQISTVPPPQPLREPPSHALGADLPSIDYVKQVAAFINRVKSYPEKARAAGQQGTAVVRFTIARSGQVGSVTLVRSSGSEALDEAALALVRRAAPFPPLQADFTGNLMTLTLPLSFGLR